MRFRVLAVLPAVLSAFVACSAFAASEAGFECLLEPAQVVEIGRAHV